MTKEEMLKHTELKPTLFESEHGPVKNVECKADDGSYLGCFMANSPGMAEFKTGSEAIWDFGEHFVGYFSFRISITDVFPDAPIRLKIKFAETPYEMHRDFGSYTGTLASSWFQEEIVNCDSPTTYVLPRRYSFRYVKITVLSTARTVKIDNLKVKAVTSADYTRLKEIKCENSALSAIDKVAVKTLAECMQEIYEDGPKRDRRLWLGDLRVQALCDYYVFKNYSLAKRCLYMFAYFEKETEPLPPCVFEKPFLYDVSYYMTDYSLLFTVALSEYLEHTGDTETAKNLFPTAKKQIDIVLGFLGEDKIITEERTERAFIDHGAIYNQPAALQGVLLFALNKFCSLASALNKNEISEEYTNKLSELRIASRKHLYNEETHVFKGEPYSLATQVWMVLGNVLDKNEAKTVLKKAISSAELMPVSPYAHHYVVEALVETGMLDEAQNYILSYWGKMVDLGADTFWEIFDPQDPHSSIYGDDLINSACHAWSCSPAYFIRKYFCK